MSFWWLALKDTMQIGRDKKALLTLVFMPILLIGILGAAFGNLMGEEDTPIQKFTIGIVNLDEGELGSILEKEVFEESLSSMVTVKSMEKQELQLELEGQNLSAGLILPTDFSAAVMSGETTKIEIISIPSAEIEAMVVENVVQQFIQTSAVQVAGMELAVEAAIIAGEPLRDQPLPNPSLEVEQSLQVVKEVPIEAEKKQVGSFQYYSAGMGVMFLLMTVVIGVSAMIEEKEQEVYKRLLVTTLTHSQYLLGKLLGLLFLSTIQLSIIIFGTSLLFGVDWGESLTGILLIGFAYIFSVCGLGVLIGSLVKTEKTFSAAGMLGTQIMAAAGGSMVPLYFFPDWMNEIMQVFPNALALQTFLELMAGEQLRGVVSEAAMLLLMGMLFLAIAGWLRHLAERRKTYA